VPHAACRERVLLRPVMHELSIAMSLVDLACEEAARLGGPRVEALHVRIGPLAGVVCDALAFSFALAAADTAVAAARLVIEPVDVAVTCDACGVERVIASPHRLRCPVCDAPTPNVVRGRELQLVALEIDDHVAPNR
jgi:hydrogenase nickel incorporation protein HypA/HybF